MNFVRCVPYEGDITRFLEELTPDMYYYVRKRYDELSESWFVDQGDFAHMCSILTKKSPGRA